MKKFLSMLMAVKTAKKSILLAWALPPFVIIAWGFSWFLIKRDVSLELTLVLLSTPLLLAPLTALIVNIFVPIAINWRQARKYAISSSIAYSLYALAFLIIDWSISHISLDDEGFIAPFLEFLCAYIPISCFVFLEVTGSSNLGAHLHAIRKTQGSISSSDLIKVWGQDPVIKNLLAWVLPVLGGLVMIY